MQNSRLFEFQFVAGSAQGEHSGYLPNYPSLPHPLLLPPGWHRLVPATQEVLHEVRLQALLPRNWGSEAHPEARANQLENEDKILLLDKEMQEVSSSEKTLVYPHMSLEPT